MPNDKSSRPIRLGTTTRGNGKVFSLIETSIDAPVWEAESRTRDDHVIPAKVHTLDDGSKALIVPALAVAQDVTIRAVNDDGTTVAQEDHRIDAHIAKLRSQANTLLHNPRIATLRNCDAEPSTDELVVWPLRLIAREDNADLLHLLVFFSLYDPADGQLPVELEVLGPDGSSIVVGEPVLLGDDVEEFPHYPGIHYRAVQYSLPIAQCNPWFCLHASCPDSPLSANFTCAQPHEMRQMFDAWHPVVLGYEGPDPDYEAWLNATRAPEREREVQRRTSADFAIQPTFSIVVPLYHTPIDFFHDMADSVLAQTYPNWELVLVNSTPEDADLAQAVSDLAAREPRVRVVTLDHNLGITENTNAGVDAATGDFISFFDHDDLLEPELLYWYVRGINDYPTTDLLYCDEDKLLDGHYIEPFYKPDWDPFFLETNNYVCHLLTVRRSVIDQLPRPTAELDGAQDHRLALAAGEIARNVYHARRMLYHWRIHALSTAADGEAKPESLIAGRLAIQSHFDRLGLHVRLDDLPKSPHCYVPVYEGVELPSISAVVAPGADEGLTEETVASLEALGIEDLQIVTCGTTADADDTARLLAEGIRQATGDYLLLLAAGVTMCDLASLQQLAAVAMRPDVAIASPKSILPDGTNQHNGMNFHEGNFFVLNRYFYHSFNADRAITVLPHQVTAGTTDCLMLSRETYDELGGVRTDAPGDLWGTLLCLEARTRGLAVVQQSPSLVMRRLGPDDLTLDIERPALSNGSKRSYLLRTYPQIVCLTDHFYKPLV